MSTALPLLRRSLGLLLLPLLAVPSAATWSIVAIKKSTGEVCVASATCLANFQLGTFLPVIVVGRGAGAAQSSIDTTGGNRMRIWNGIMNGMTPDEILDELAANDGAHQSRQYGIVSCDGPPVTFTGSGAGPAQIGVTGDIDGDIFYAIQGNVLAGDMVVFVAETAFRDTVGDLGQKAMAGMEAARFYGGDGRCSCSQSQPASCGTPPPSFTHSAYTAFIKLARIGDTLGNCSQLSGCANGDYYLDRKFVGNANDPDPVIKLQERYDNWRANRIGRVDHILTEVHSAAPQLVADGVTSTEVTVVLRDIDGTQLPAGGQLFTFTDVSDVPGSTSVSAVTDNGDGTHTFTVTATSQPGESRWQMVVQDVNQFVQLYPDLSLEVDPLTELHVGYDVISASQAPVVPMVLNRGAADAGRAYQLLGSALGTSPGTPWPGGGTVPLNRDRIFNFTFLSPGPPTLPGSAGNLDATGRAEGAIAFDSFALGFYVGEHFDFSAVLFGSPDEFTTGAGFDVAP